MSPPSSDFLVIADIEEIGMTFEFVGKLDMTNPTGIFNVGLRTSEAGL